MITKLNYAVVIPLANEESGFATFTAQLKEILNLLDSGKVYFVLDRVSKDRTQELCHQLQEKDQRFELVWSPENKNVVDAYLAGYRVAYQNGHELIIEMDGGMSHDPRAIPMFLRTLVEGNDCAFGSRFINGGSIQDSSLYRHILSRGGTYLSNTLLGSDLKDMTSGFQGFHRSIVKLFIEYQLRSTGHFYQTELRYLLRNCRLVEVPIHYRAPSNSVSQKSIKNSLSTLWYYLRKRITFKSLSLSEPKAFSHRKYYADTISRSSYNKEIDGASSTTPTHL